MPPFPAAPTDGPLRTAKRFFLNHVHGLNAIDKNTRAAKSFEAEHGSHDPFDGTIVLLNNVVEGLDLTQFDVSTGVGPTAVDGGGVGTALVDGDLFRQIVQPDGPLQKTPGGRQIATGRQKEVEPESSQSCIDWPIKAECLFYLKDRI